jgi:tetratricopeptide (TPR) repeat protein
MKKSHSAEALKTDSSEATSVFTPHWQIPPQLSAFTGRESELNTLMSNLSQPNQHWVIQKSSQITGTGGIGKTQLAVECVHRTIIRKLFTTVLWFNADCTYHDQLNIEFQRLAKALNIDVKLLSKKQVVRTVYKKISVLGSCLVVFDGAAKEQDIVDYLPQCETTEVSIIVTSREDKTWKNSFHQITLDIFSAEEAVAYIKKVLPNHLFNNTAALNLAEQLGFFPLGLAQATGYIITRNIAITDYLGLYQAKQTDQKKLLSASPLTADPHKNSIYITLQLCLEQIKNPLTLEILTAAAYLAPEVPIGESLLQKWCGSPSECANAINILRQFSLLESTSTINHAKIHQLVQSVLRIDHHDKAKIGILEKITSCISLDYSSENSPLADERRQQALMPHIQYTQHHISTLPVVKEREWQWHTAKLSRLYCGCLLQLGQYADSAKHAQIALAVYEVYPCPLEMVLTNNVMGNSIVELGRYFEAIKYYQRSLELCQTHDIINAELEGNILNNLALALGYIGDYEEQKRILSFVLKCYEEIYGPDHIEIAVTLNNLAICYTGTTEHDTAIKLLLRALALLKKQYGDKHEILSRTLTNLGNAYRLFNASAQAIEYYLDAQKIIHDKFGQDHLINAGLLMNLGEAYYSTDNFDQALTTFQRALTIIENDDAIDYTKKVECMNCLTKCCATMRQPDLEYKYIHQAMSIIHSKDQVPSVLYYNTCRRFGKALTNRQDNKTAIEVYKTLLSHCQSQFGEDSVEVADTFSELGAIYLDVRLFDLALDALEHAYSTYLKIYKNDDPKLLDILVNLCGVYLQANSMEKAKFLISTAQSIINIFPSTNRQHQIALYSHLASIYHKEGHHHHALEVYDKALKMLQTQQPIDWHKIGIILNNSSNVYASMGDHVNCVANLQKVIEIFSQHYHPAHLLVGQALINYGKGLCKLTKNHLGESALLRALGIYSKFYGRSHPQTVHLSQSVLDVVSNCEHYKLGSFEDKSAIIAAYLDQSEPLTTQQIFNIADICIYYELFKIAVPFLSTIEHARCTPTLIHCHLALNNIEAAEACLLVQHSDELALKIANRKHDNILCIQKLHTIKLNNIVSEKDVIIAAQCYRKLGENTEAINLLDTILSREAPKQFLAAAFFQKSLCLENLEEYALALRCCNESMHLNPRKEVRVLYHKLRICMKLMPMIVQLLSQVRPELVTVLPGPTL